MRNIITEIQIIPIKPRDGLIGFASLVFDDQLYFGSIGIHTKLNGNGYRITYPTKNINSKSINIYHPINKEVSEVIEKAIISKFKEVMEKSNDRYNSFNNPI